MLVMAHPDEFRSPRGGSNWRHLLHRGAKLALAAALGICVFRTHFTAYSAKSATRPNVLLIITDDK
jgi:hypothetical protein